MYNEDVETIQVNQYIQSHRGEFNKEIGLAIRNYRLNNNIPINVVSERSMMTISYLNQIENGINGISLIKFICICNALEAKPQEIIESFIFGGNKNEDLIYNELQKEKNLSKNILEFMKQKDCEDNLICKS